MWRRAVQNPISASVRAFRPSLSKAGVTRLSDSNAHTDSSIVKLAALLTGGALLASVTFADTASTTEQKIEEEEAVTPLSLARRNSMRKQKKFYPYVIVGAGTTAHAAIEAIRQREPNAEILLLSDEPALPRVDADWRTPDGAVEPISDSLMNTFNEWRRHVMSSLSSEPDAYSTTPVTLLLGKRDMHFDVDNKRILLQDGTQVHYDKCLLANAGKPRNFYVLNSNRMSYMLKDRINTCTTISDFEQLDSILKNASTPDSSIMNVSVIGGGFLGTEIASSLATDKRSKQLNVQQIFVESYPLARYLPEYLAKNIKSRLEQRGVQIMADRLVTAVKSEADTTGNESDTSIVLSLMGDTKEKMLTDYVALCSTHINPSVNLAKESSLEIDSKNNGIVVNSHLEAAAGIYVAGNLASYYDTSLGRRRVDMYDHAVNSGLSAGHNMVASKAGKSKSYVHQPMFQSNLEGIDVLLEGVGNIDSNLEMVGIWLNKDAGEGDFEPQRGIVYYLEGSKVTGILLWNASDLLESARQFLNRQPDVRDREALKTAISIGPDEWLHIVGSKK